MPRRNDIDVAIEEIVSEYHALKKAAKNSTIPQIGMENTDIRSASKQFQAMGPDERKKTQERIGPKSTMEIIRFLQKKDPQPPPGDQFFNPELEG